MGIFRKNDKVEITKGVLKGSKGKIVDTNERDRYGRSHTMQTDDGTLIRPVTDDELKRRK